MALRFSLCWPGAPLLAVCSQGAGDGATMPLHLLRHHGHFAVLLARRPYDDLDILPKRNEELHEPFDGKGAGALLPGRIRRDLRRGISGLGILSRDSRTWGHRDTDGHRRHNQALA
jgi:hypothetical protein